ncbi:MAG TPA: hypothetical protein VL977_03245 [Solirubrobacteraceae bacterium]|nr:hypothetical protein [Solirubrobacteraceae bacterium]
MSQCEVQDLIGAAIAEYGSRFARGERFAPLADDHGLPPAAIARVCGQLLRASGMTVLEVASRDRNDHEEDAVYVVAV